MKVVHVNEYDIEMIYLKECFNRFFKVHESLKFVEQRRDEVNVQYG